MTAGIDTRIRIVNRICMINIAVGLLMLISHRAFSEQKISYRRIEWLTMSRILILNWELQDAREGKCYTGDLTLPNDYTVTITKCASNGPLSYNDLAKRNVALGDPLVREGATYQLIDLVVEVDPKASMDLRLLATETEIRCIPADYIFGAHTHSFTLRDVNSLLLNLAEDWGIFTDSPDEAFRRVRHDWHRTTLPIPVLKINLRPFAAIVLVWLLAAVLAIIMSAHLRVIARNTGHIKEPWLLLDQVNATEGFDSALIRKLSSWYYGFCALLPILVHLGALDFMSYVAPLSPFLVVWSLACAVPTAHFAMSSVISIAEIEQRSRGQPEMD